MASYNKRSLDTIDFTNDIEHIESPRSKKALIQMGIEEHKLFFLSLQDYIRIHPEIKGASQEIQQKRYSNYESKRQQRLSQAKEIRNMLIKAEEKDNTNPSSPIELRKSQSYSNVTDSFYRKEMDRLDQMQKHQISEVKSIIDYELQMTSLRYKTDEKIKLYLEQEEQAKEQRLKDQLNKAIRQRIEEREKEERLKQEHLKHYDRVKQKDNEDQQLKEEENRRKVQLDEERYRRQQDQIQHQREIQKKLDLLIHQQKKEQEQKQKMNEQKEENRRRLFEERKREYFLKSQRMNSNAQEKICKTNIKNEEELLNKRMAFEKKQMLKSHQMKQYADELERRNQEHNDKVRAKQRKIIEFTQRNYILSLQRIDDYDTKNDFIHQIRQQNKEKRRQELLMKIAKNKLLEKDNSKRKEQVDASITLKNVMLLEKYYQSDDKIRLQKEIGYRPIKDKLIDHKIQLEEVSENFALSNKLFEYKKQMKLEEMTEKTKRVEEYQTQKSRIIEKSKRCQEKMKRRKEEMLNKIHRLLKSGKVFTPEQMYKKVFNKEEYETLLTRTQTKFYRSTRISPNQSRYDFSPKLMIDKDKDKDKDKDEVDGYKTANKWHTIKVDDSNSKDNSKIINKGNNEDDEGLFVTQERYKSLDKILSN